MGVEDLKQIEQEAAKQGIINCLSNGKIPDAILIMHAYNDLKKVILSPEVQEAAKQGMIRCFLTEQTVNALLIKNEFKVSDEIILSPEVQEAAKQGMIRCFLTEQTVKALLIKNEFKVSEEVSLSHEVQEAAKQGMINCLSIGRINNALQIKKAFKVSDEVILSPEVQEAAKQGMIRYLLTGQINSVLQIKNEFKVSDEIILSPEVQEAAKREMIRKFSKGWIESALKIKNEFKVSDEVILSPEVQAVVKQKIIIYLPAKLIDNALQIINEFKVSDTEILFRYYNYGKENEVNKPTEDQKELAFLWEFREKEDIPKRIRESEELKRLVIEIYENTELLPFIEEIADARRKYFVSPEIFANTLDDLDSNEQAKLIADLKKLKGENFYKKIFNEIFLPHEKDENIVPFIKKAEEFFGAEMVLRYANRPDLSLHDAFFFFQGVIEICEKNNVNKDSFAVNILLQVVADNGLYKEGTAHHKFGAIVQRLAKVDFDEQLQLASRYENIESLQVLVKDIEGNSPFANWKTLKKFDELVALLQKKEILDKLKQDHGISPKLRNYISKLMFHPNINGSAVESFWQTPSKFFNMDDINTILINRFLNEVKKPKNLLTVPYLGLSPESLRDAFVEGSYDKIQTLPPMEKEFYFGVPSVEDVDSTQKLFYALWVAIGQKRKGVNGFATDPDKLFSLVQNWCKGHGIKWTDLWNEEKGGEVLSQVSEYAQEELKKLVFDLNFGVKVQKEKFQIYRAVIGNKSDPDMAIAGNDTASCDSFGSGKKNVYMFNPNCVQMVLQRKNIEGKWKTAAQSLINIDHEVSTIVPELIKKYLEEGVHLRDLVTEGDLERNPVLVCDNIQVAKNEEGQRVSNIRNVYEKFFREYLEKYADKLQISKSKVIIGNGDTPEALGFDSVSNYFLPQAPMGYSDNGHKTSYRFFTGLKEEQYDRKGMAPLTTRDSLAVSIIEGKAYRDNEKLIKNLHKMQNSIIGMEVANTHFNRPNLSFVYRNEKGAPKGYILAYEGVVENEGVQNSFVYISDIATDRESKMAGGRLIKQFFDAYFDCYGKDEKGYLPIFTNAREGASFEIIKKQVEKIAKSRGLVYKIIEIGKYNKGNDKFHNVLICLGKNEDELNRQEKAMKSFD